MSQRNNTPRLVAVIGLAALTAISAWQFYQFAVFKNSQGVADVQGGTVHLWLAIGLALIVCIGGVFLFSKFLSYDTQNEIHITSASPPLGAARNTKDVL